MKPIHYLGLGVRLFAICLILFGVYNLAGYLSSYFSDSVYDRYTVMSLPLLLVAVALPILIAVLMWSFPLTIAYKLLGSEDKEFEPISPVSILTILVASIGLFFLYQSLMDTVYWFLSYSFFSARSSTFSFGPNEKAAAVSTAVELAIAVILTLRCKSIAKLMARIAR